MKENPLKNIKGKKIRCQYFTIPVLIPYVIMFLVPYCIFVFSIRMGEFDMREWLGDLWISVYLCFIFSLPWIVLKILTRLCLGRIICVLDDDGIHHKGGFIAWDRVERVEYVIDVPPRYNIDPNQKCRAVIHTENESIILLQAPLYLLRCIKKSHPKIRAKLSNGSKWLIGVLAALALLAVAVIPFMV